MKLRMWLAVLGVVVLAVACGPNPMAVDTQAVAAGGEGSATASRFRMPTPVDCQVVEVQLKAYASEPVSNGSDRRIVSLRAEYLDAAGTVVNSACDAPEWFVNPMDNSMTLSAARFDPFEARLVAGKGAYVIVAIGPYKTSGAVKVSW